MRSVLTGTGCVLPQGISELEPLEVPGGGAALDQGFVVKDFVLKDYIPTVTSYVDRCSALAMAAARLALDDAGIDAEQARSGDWGLAYATAWGCLDSMELFFAKVAKNPKFASPLIFSHAYANSPSSLVCIEFGLSGPGATFCEGETGALTALGWARDRLERTRGSECCGMLIAASDALSAGRRRHYAASGETLGEAGVAITLELEDAARSRGAEPFAVVRGWGSALGDDAAARAVRLAMQEAEVACGQLAAAFGSAELTEVTGCEMSVLAEDAGLCGPGGALLAVSRTRGMPHGKYLVVAEDPCGSAVAVVIERID
jgi:3-oxoacyl-[acyl-carrier-protein] synthase II